MKFECDIAVVEVKEVNGRLTKIIKLKEEFVKERRIPCSKLNNKCIECLPTKNVIKLKEEGWGG